MECTYYRTAVVWCRTARTSASRLSACSAKCIPYIFKPQHRSYRAHLSGWCVIGGTISIASNEFFSKSRQVGSSALQLQVSKKNEGIERVKLFYDPKNAVYAIVFVMLFDNIDLQYIYD